ncbi:Transcription factor MYB52, partial [Mucuna pruriens]
MSFHYICLGKSCKLRWLNHFDPKLKKSSFTKDEEDRLLMAHQIYKTRWSTIITLFPSRTGYDIAALPSYFDFKLFKYKHIKTYENTIMKQLSFYEAIMTLPTQFFLDLGVDSLKTLRPQILALPFSCIFTILFLKCIVICFNKLVFEESEIKIALEDKFEISIREGGVENIFIIQDDVDLIKKMKTTSK